MATNNLGLLRLEWEETAEKRLFPFSFFYLEDVWLILVGILLYALTIAPALTWANGGADGGDLVAAAVSNGVPHPPGYPLYITLARLFLMTIPWGTFAFRVNLLSVVCGILSALIMRHWLMYTLPRGGLQQILAFWGAIALLSTPMPWSQSVIAEVYSLNLLLVLCFLLSLQGQRPLLQGLWLGLAISHHTLNLALIPLLFFSNDNKRNPLILSFGIVAGFLPYALIPWRAWQDPVINWGNPSDWQNLAWVLRGELYIPYLAEASFSAILARLSSLFALWLENLSPVGIFLALHGFLSPMPRKLWLQSGWLWVAYNGVSLLYQSYDSYLYIIPALISWILWASRGIHSLLLNSPSATKKWWVASLFLALTIAILIRFPYVSAANDSRAESFGETFRRNIPANALIFADDDQAIFALWYFHFSLGQRSDTHVIAQRLLQYSWYTENITQIYPDLSFPTHSAPWSEDELIEKNSQYPLCFMREMPAVHGLYTCFGFR